MNRKFTSFCLLSLLHVFAPGRSYSQVILNDDFSSGTQGWSFFFQWGCTCPGVCSPYSCQAYYDFTTDAGTGVNEPSAHISGDFPGSASGTWNSSFNCNAGISKTVSLPAISACDSLILSFNYRAKSSNSTSTITNAWVRIFDSTTNTFLDGELLVAGGTTDTGWQLHTRNITSQAAGTTLLKIVLFTSDGWSQNWNKEVWFDNVKLEIVPGAQPTSDFTAPDTVCISNEATITFTGNAGSAATFNWDFGSAVNVSGSDAGPYQLSFPSTGTYDISLSVDENGCTSIVSTHSIVVTPAPVSLFTVSNTGVCQSEEITVEYTGNASTNAIYSWTFDGATILASSDWLNTIAYASAGTYVIALMVEENGCTSPVYADTVIINPRPQVAFSAPELNGCESLDVQFQNNSSGASSFTWSFGDGTFDSATNPFHTYGIGVYDVSLVAVSPDGCMDSVTYPEFINVLPDPVAAFTVSPSINEPTQLSDAVFTFSNQSQHASSFLWMFGDEDTDTISSPVHQYTVPGNYAVTLFAFNTLGCKDSVTRFPIVIIPDNNIFIPNTFSPNNDNLNDKFKVYGENITGLELNVYNRWGEQVFTTKDPLGGWDGSYKGMKVNTGIYVFFATITFANGYTEARQGDVTVIH